MAESHVVAALITKRTELAGLTEHHRKEMRRLGDDLADVDAMLKLFSPEIDLRTIRTSAHRMRNRFFRTGECQSMVLDILKPGSVIVDVAIDQGGCCETAKATTHAAPTYMVGNVVHYCVANMPGGVPRTSTYALNNATLPFALQIADKGWRQALQDDEHLRNGLNVAFGKVTCREVAEDLGYAYHDAPSVLSAG